MAKLERLLNLTAALLETERPLTAEELRTRIEGYPPAFQSFRRTFERDKDDLREMGIPVTLEEVPGTDPMVEGYRIRKDDYYLQDPGLAPDELAALHLAARAVQVEGISGAEALRKLGGVRAESAPNDDDALVSVPNDPNVTVLFEAVASQRLAQFTYSNVDRELEPHRLDFVRGRWYVTGFDRVRAADRNFRLDRIDGAVEVGPSGAFERQASTDPGVRRAPWELGDEAATIARFLVDPDQAAWAAHHVGQIAERRPDGSVVLEVAVANEDAFRSFALTFLEHGEILSPPDIRERMIDWLREVAES